MYSETGGSGTLSERGADCVNRARIDPEGRVSPRRVSRWRRPPLSPPLITAGKLATVAASGGKLAPRGAVYLELMQSLGRLPPPRASFDPGRRVGGYSYIIPNILAGSSVLCRRDKQLLPVLIVEERRISAQNLRAAHFKEFLWACAGSFQ